MPNLKEVRSRIISVKSTQQITKAMKMVAAAKLRRAQNNILQMRPYAKKLDEVLRNVSAAISDGDFVNHYSVERPVEKVLLVVITSDKGLCGAFNTNIVRTTNMLINEKYAHLNKKGNLTLLCIGKKGYDIFKRRNVKIIDEYVGLLATKDINFDAIKKAAEYAMTSFVEGKYDRVEVIYNEFRNVATQIIRNEAFLPIKNAPSDEASKSASNTDYIFEPSMIEIVEELIPKSLKIQFFKYLLESNASEHGSRMTAMDKATENAGELLKELQLSYNRVRQANITKEILEIVGGAEALNQG